MGVQVGWVCVMAHAYGECIGVGGGLLAPLTTPKLALLTSPHSPQHSLPLVLSSIGLLCGNNNVQQLCTVTFLRNRLQRQQQQQQHGQQDGPRQQQAHLGMVSSMLFGSGWKRTLLTAGCVWTE